MASPGEKKLLYIEKCNWNNCQEVGKSKCAGCWVVFYCSQQHQKLDWRCHKPNCLNWTISNIEGGQKCLIARKEIKEGAILLVDQPLFGFRDLESTGNGLEQTLLVAGANSYPCVACSFGHLDVKDPHFCTKCSIPLCNEKCENNILHVTQECPVLQELVTQNARTSKPRDNIYQDVSILRVLIEIQRSDNARKMILEFFQDKRIQSISDNLCFNQATDKLTQFPKNDFVMDDDNEYLFPLSFKYCRDDRLIKNIYCAMRFFSNFVKNGDGEKVLYRNRILLDHSCVPNAEMWTDSSLNYYKLIVRANCTIRPGEKITICVDESLLYMATLERRNILKTVHQIECKCMRCTEPTECGLFVSGIRCAFSNCQDGYLVPKFPMDESSVWKCHLQNCNQTKGSQEIRAMILKLENELAYTSAVEANAYWRIKDFIKNNKRILHRNHILMQKATFQLYKIANYFLGSGPKLVLCVIAGYKHAIDRCESKVQYLERRIRMRYKLGLKEDLGKLVYELACGRLALELMTLFDVKLMDFDRDYLKDCIKKLNKVYFLFNDATALSNASLRTGSDYWNRGSVDFANILSDWLKSLLPLPKDEGAFNQAIKSVIFRTVDRWIDFAHEINLVDEYKNPKSKVFLGVKSLMEILVEKSQETPVRRHVAICLD